jgi:glucokinase
MVESSDHLKKRVGIEISTRGINAVVIDDSNNIAAARAIAQSEVENSVSGITSVIDALRSDLHDFDRVGIAVPGLVDRNTGRVAFSANLPGHSEVDLAKDVSAATGVAVILENDANAAAFGEFSLGAGRGSKDLFYVTLGDGVGGAFIIAGKIWRGDSGFAGEFGYVTINSAGMRLEEVASASNIVRRTRSRFHQDSTSSLNKLAEESITLQDIITAAEREDDFAQMMLQRTGRYVGTAVASVINLLNIEKVVVGGKIMQAKHLVLDAIKERARELSFAPAFRSTTIVEGELGENAAAVGAAFLSGDKRTDEFQS